MDFFVTNVLLVFVAFSAITTTSAFHQYIKLVESEDEGGNSHFINTNIPDTTIYSLDRTKNMCPQGCWIWFNSKKYQGYAGQAMTNAEFCLHTEFAYLSLRHLGPSNVSLNAISLYSGPNYEGTELLVDRSPYAGIKTSIGSLALTGSEPWTIFQGTNFDGSHVCLDKLYLYACGEHRSLDVGLTHIGSMFLGCPSTVDEKLREHARAIYNEGRYHDYNFASL